MNLGFPEMVFLFVLALIIFGPKKLPEIGRQIGKGLAEFKRASNEFQAQIQDEVRKLELEDVKNSIAPISLENTVSYSPQPYTPPALTPVASEPAPETHSNGAVTLNGNGTPEEPTNRANA
ncbi:MAG TPA: twin-arginine translocase TatA/TatE family subunit [Terriglobales bacterium]